VIGADGARSNVAKTEVKGGDKIPYVIAYHEIIESPGGYDPDRCDVVYDGRISPDFYGWVFPHGKSASVGMGSFVKEVDLKKATADLREASGLADCETIRKEGAPIPLKPLDRMGQWPRRGAGRRCRGRGRAVLGRRHLLRHGRRPRGRHRGGGRSLRPA
jgi:geranylgeranyl reductase